MLNIPWLQSQTLLLFVCLVVFCILFCSLFVLYLKVLRWKMTQNILVGRMNYQRCWYTLIFIPGMVMLMLMGYCCWCCWNYIQRWKFKMEMLRDAFSFFLVLEFISLAASLTKCIIYIYIPIYMNIVWNSKQPNGLLNLIWM